MTQLAEKIKFFGPAINMLLSSLIIGGFVFASGQFTLLNSQIAQWQLRDALASQRIENLERRYDSTEKFVDAMRMNDLRQDSSLTTISDTLKMLVEQRRPDENTRSMRPYDPDGMRGKNRTN